MRSTRKLLRRCRPGVVLIVSMMFVAIFTVISMAMATMAGSNTQIASNQRQLNRAFTTAESGLEVMRYWLTRVRMPNSTEQGDYFSTIINSIRNDLATNGITSISLRDNGSISPVVVDVMKGQRFFAQIRILAGQPDVLEVYVTGGNGQTMRTLKVCYDIGPERHQIFDYGIATKGPLYVQGKTGIVGLNLKSEADIYIESENTIDALSINGAARIAGDIRIGNPNAQASVAASSFIGSESGQDAIDNHVKIGSPPFDFPIMNIVGFENYVESDFDSSADTSQDMTLQNIRIPANTNPLFSGNVKIRGIMFIESPNVVQFSGDADITGIIVGEGSLAFPSDGNQLIFSGNVKSQSVSNLDAAFGDLRQETGTFLLAPGFKVSFGGNFGTLNGAIAASAIEFFGNAGGTVNGSILNYGDAPMTLDGSVGLSFDHSLKQIPAGFETEIVLRYNPNSYSMVKS